MITDLLIASRWQGGKGSPREVVNPANGEIIASIGTADSSQVEEAVNTAAVAAARTEWRHMLPAERASYLHRMADLILERGEFLANLQMKENGKTISECREQVKSSAGTVRYFAGVCETLESEVTPSRGNYLSFTVYEPIGVVAAITPFNSPLLLGAQKVASALAAGNAVILKPSEITSLISLELGRVCVDANLPAGLVSVLIGGPEVGDALVRHPKIGMISFTGGTQTGRYLASVASERLIPILLELGGKSPNIIFEDADLNIAVAGAAFAIFSSTGQQCTAGSRLFIQRSIYERFLSEITELTKRIRVRPPHEQEAMIGPLASFHQRKRLEQIVSEGLDQGGRVLIGGSRPHGREFDKGAYYMPTIIDGLENSSTLCQKEIFGPVVCTLPFDDEKDLIRQANDTVYGLAAGIWTGDYQRAWRVGRAIEAGTIWINTYRQSSISTPFGGFKDSGLGREKGLQGVRVYQQIKSMYMGLGPTPWIPLLRD